MIKRCMLTLAFAVPTVVSAGPQAQAKWVKCAVSIEPGAGAPNGVESLTFDLRFADDSSEATIIEYYDLPGDEPRALKSTTDKAEVDEMEVRAEFEASYTNAGINVRLNRESGYINYWFVQKTVVRGPRGGSWQEPRWTRHMSGPCEVFTPNQKF